MMASGSISSAHGSALVRLGDTTVLCGINAEIAEPDLLAPHSGYLGKNVLAREMRYILTNIYSAKCRSASNVLA